MASDNRQSETEAPDTNAGGEPAWEPSEYHFEEPWWFEMLFSPWFAGLGMPLVVTIIYVGYRLIAG